MPKCKRKQVTTGRRYALQKYDRFDGFPCSTADEISVCTWNLLAPSLHEAHPGSLGWERRRPAFKQCLASLRTCDILCFQEVDIGLVAEELCNILAGYGFTALLQERKGFPVVNATFFKTGRFRLAWVEHRSRVLLTGLALADGRVLGVTNVHLEAGNTKKNESQREAMLDSAIHRMRTHKPWCVIACGDFNCSLAPGSILSERLRSEGFSKVPCDGYTIAISGREGTYIDTLDHIWAEQELQQRAVLTSSAQTMRMIVSNGLPDSENPSDHLPVASIFGIDCVAPTRYLPLQLSPLPDETLRREWLLIRNSIDWSIRLDARRNRKAMREHRALEDAFFEAIGPRDTESLRQWYTQVTEAARAAVAMNVARCQAHVRELQSVTQVETMASTNGLCPQGKTVWDPGGIHCWRRLVNKFMRVQTQCEPWVYLLLRLA